MLFKQSVFLIVCLGILFGLAAPNSDAQKKNSIRKKNPQKTSFKRKASKKFWRKPIISGGVMNGKALFLAHPEYPPSALMIRVRGTVAVLVLIDENGDVVQAKALRGNLLLIPASLRAAKTSKFKPFVLGSGDVLKVSGVILYNYNSNKLNWLEIGYSFENPAYIYSNKLEDFLPAGFDQEKQMLSQTNTLPPQEQKEILQIVSSSIENKLSSDHKNVWLFSVGKEIGKLSNNYWGENKEIINNLQNLFFSIPDGVSATLKISLENLILSGNKGQDIFNKNLTDLIERLYGLGN